MFQICFAIPDDGPPEVPKHVTVLIPAVKSDTFNNSILVILNHDITVAGSRGVSISGSNAGYTMLRSSVKGTGYPLHSPVSPLHFPTRASTCAITFQLESTTLTAVSSVGEFAVNIVFLHCPVGGINSKASGASYVKLSYCRDTHALKPVFCIKKNDNKQRKPCSKLDSRLEKLYQRGYCFFVIPTLPASKLM